MALITKTYTFSNGATIVAAEHNQNFDTMYNDYNGNITNANISASAAIADSKLAGITTSGKVSGAAALSILALAYPVGSIYINATDSTNPATLLGFGTWTAFGAGRVMVGLDSGDTDWDTAEETRGSKTVATSNHQHKLPIGDISGNALGIHTTTPTYGSSGSISVTQRPTMNASVGTATAYLSESAGGETLNVIQPSIVVYLWKRTA